MPKSIFRYELDKVSTSIQKIPLPNHVFPILEQYLLVLQYEILEKLVTFIKKYL